MKKTCVIRPGLLCTTRVGRMRQPHIACRLTRTARSRRGTHPLPLFVLRPQQRHVSRESLGSARRIQAPSVMAFPKPGCPISGDSAQQNPVEIKRWSMPTPSTPPPPDPPPRWAASHTNTAQCDRYKIKDAFCIRIQRLEPAITIAETPRREIQALAAPEDPRNRSIPGCELHRRNREHSHHTVVRLSTYLERSRLFGLSPCEINVRSGADSQIRMRLFGAFNRYMVQVAATNCVPCSASCP